MPAKPAALLPNGVPNEHHTPLRVRPRRAPIISTSDYGWKSWLFTTDHKRIALLYLFSITAFFFVGGAFAVGMRIESAHAGRPLFSRHLQQAVHHARDHHGVLLPGPVHSGDARQLSGADDDRRARSGVSAHQSVELVYLHRRRHRCAHGGRRRAASIPAGPFMRLSAPPIRIPT